MNAHLQVQRMIQAALDGQLMDEHKWLVLHRHLEICPDCRAYQARLQGMESALRRGLHQDMDPRWNSIPGPRRDLPERVTSRLRGAQLRAQLLGAAGAAVVTGLLLVLLISGGLLAPAPLESATATPAAGTPTPSSGAFAGQIAYESRRDGNAEIYLLNTGYADPPGVSGGAVLTQWVDTVNLTQNPAEDTDPSWSPDGEWLAFLSNRTGKTEVYAIHVSGARLTQLTDLPDVDWQGPISWSADGQRLALIGEQNGKSWVFLLRTGPEPADRRPVRLGYSSGATAVKFSPAQPMLVYQTGPTNRNGLIAYDLSKLTYTGINWNATKESKMHAGVGGAFDWSPDGRSLIYRAQGPFDGAQPGAGAAEEIRVQYDVEFKQPGEGNSANLGVAFAHSLGAFRSISWAAWAGQIAYLKEGENGCWMLHLQAHGYPFPAPKVMEGFCIDAGLERSNWQAEPYEDNDSWLIFTGYHVADAYPGLFAARIPNPDHVEAFDEVQYVRLLGGEAISGMPRLRPARLPDTNPLAIDPQPPALAQTKQLPAAEIPADLPGRLLLTGKILDQSTLTALAPNGSRKGLFEANAEMECAAWSPDRSRLAFLSDLGSTVRGVNEIFVLDADGENLRQVTQPRFPVDTTDASPTPRYECPVWSPDGTRLAAVAKTRQQSYLAVLNADGSEPRFIRVSAPSYWSNLTWTPDSRAVLVLANTYEKVNRPQLLLVDPNQITNDEKGEGAQVLLVAEDWDDAAGFSFSPNGSQLTWIAMKHDRFETNGALMVSEVARTGTGELQLSSPVKLLDLPAYQPRWNSQSLAWLPDGRISFLVGRMTNQPIKLDAYLFDPRTGRQATLVQTEDVVLSAAWSQDGTWLAYSAESGVYLLNIQAAVEGRAGPARISEDAVLDLDW